MFPNIESKKERKKKKLTRSVITLVMVTSRFGYNIKIESKNETQNQTKNYKCEYLLGFLMSNHCK